MAGPPGIERVLLLPRVAATCTRAGVLLVLVGARREIGAELFSDERLRRAELRLERRDPGFEVGHGVLRGAATSRLLAAPATARPLDALLDLLAPLLDLLGAVLELLGPLLELLGAFLELLVFLGQLLELLSGVLELLVTLLELLRALLAPLLEVLELLGSLLELLDDAPHTHVRSHGGRRGADPRDGHARVHAGVALRVGGRADGERGVVRGPREGVPVVAAIGFVFEVSPAVCLRDRDAVVVLVPVVGDRLVDVPDQEPAAGKVGVEPVELPVLHHEVLRARGAVLPQP